MRTGHLPRQRPPTRCDRCDALVVWAENDRGRRVPVDATQVLPGLGANLVLWYEVDLLNQPVGTQRVSFATPEQLRTGPVWWLHFATCPRATVYRRMQALRGEL